MRCPVTEHVTNESFSNVSGNLQISRGRFDLLVVENNTESTYGVWYTRGHYGDGKWWQGRRCSNRVGPGSAHTTLQFASSWMKPFPAPISCSHLYGCYLDLLSECICVNTFLGFSCGFLQIQNPWFTAAFLCLQVTLKRSRRWFKCPGLSSTTALRPHSVFSGSQKSSHVLSST